MFSKNLNIIDLENRLNSLTNRDAEPGSLVKRVIKGPYGLEKLNGFKFLIISDTHSNLTEKQKQLIDKNRKNVNFIITLGDIPVESMKYIKCNYGVLGNHDSFKGIPNENNLHMRCIKEQNISLSGFEGSNRYKNGNFVLYLQQESLELLDKLPRSDIFITHDSCLNSKYSSMPFDYIDDSHSGLIGIDKYIERKKPLLHIHGHYHQNDCIIHYGVPSVGVYGVSLLTIENKNLIIEILDSKSI